MSEGFILDADVFIPTGVPATPERVAELVAEGTLPADKVTELVAEQQPEDLKAAVLDVIAAQVSETDAVVADYTQILKDIGATKTEANAVVKAWGQPVETIDPAPVEIVAEEI